MNHIEILPETGITATIPPKYYDTENLAPDADQTDLCARFPGGLKRAAPRTEIMSEGEPSDELIIIRRGWVMQYRILEDGRRQVTQFGLPGDIIGFRADPAAPLSASVEAITECEYAAVPLKIVGRILRQGGRDAQQFYAGLAVALDAAHDALTDAGRRTALEAVAHFIWRISQKVVEYHGAGADAEIEFPLNQEQIGDHLGLTAVHVCRTLCKLKALGAVTIGRGRLRVNDPVALAEIAGVSEANAEEWSIAG